MNKWKLLLPIIFVSGVMSIIEIVIHQGLIPSYLVPAPTEVWNVLFEQSVDFRNHFLSTAINALVGLLQAFVLAVILSIFLAASRISRMIILPYAVFFQTVPVIAISPLLVVWFGFGSKTVQIASLLVSFFPLLTNILSGLLNITKDQDELFKLYKANYFQRLFYLMFPKAIPQIFIGLRISVGLSVIGAIVGEFVAGGGLGGMIDSARTQQRVDIIFAALLLSSILGLLGLSVLGFIEFLWKRKNRIQNLEVV